MLQNYSMIFKVKQLFNNKYQQYSKSYEKKKIKKNCTYSPEPVQSKPRFKIYVLKSFIPFGTVSPISAESS